MTKIKHPATREDRIELKKKLDVRKKTKVNPETKANQIRKKLYREQVKAEETANELQLYSGH
jgi:hypothetical protein